MSDDKIAEVGDILSDMEDVLGELGGFVRAIYLMASGLTDRDAQDAFQRVAIAAQETHASVEEQRERAWLLTCTSAAA